MSERECPLCHEILGHDAPEAVADTRPSLAQIAADFTARRDRLGPVTVEPEWDEPRERRWIPGTTDYEWVPVAAKPEPLYRVIWGRGPTSTLPMLWPAVLRFVAAARKARPQYPIRVVACGAVPQSPTHRPGHESETR